MFRLSQMMRRLVRPEGKRPTKPRPATGPVVVWNLIRRCNLTCQHCYTASTDKTFQGELSTGEVFRVLEELRAYGVPALILSGGEPLLRADLFEIAHRAKNLGFYLGLSSNGTMIGDKNVAPIAEVGFDYVGISFDGMEKHHDRIRGRKGAFRAAWAGLQACRDHGIRVGVRFTPTRENSDDLPTLMGFMDKEGIDRFYLSHWNDAGRGLANRAENAAHQATRRLMAFLFDRCWQETQAGVSREIVTGNNDADGVLFLMWVRRHLPEQAEEAEKWLVRWGGNASGVGVANIDNRGRVHPDIFWWHHTLGDLRQQPFAEIWQNPDEPLLAGLRQQPRPVTGRCGSCRYLSICGGNTRVRAWQRTGDPWTEDPGCYLTDLEIGGN